MTHKKILEVLDKFNIDHSILDNYQEPWRFYHNIDHISSMVEEGLSMGIMEDELILAIIFHDIIYDPKTSNNEERSEALFNKFIYNPEISSAILDTKTHIPSNSLSRKLIDLDLSVLNGSFDKFQSFEDKIFKEYQFVDFKIYREKRIEILKKLGVREDLLSYVRNRKPKIGVYPGSFNPFHMGHFNILEKAENIFDKIIIARGTNPEKTVSFRENLPSMIEYRQIESYEGLLTDFIKSLEYEVTVIRGLRNSTDLQSEMTQYRFLDELMPGIKMVSIFCDIEYEHISSSSLRSLSKYPNGFPLVEKYTGKSGI
jgi:pantetheine-phosphate adenylyltransferase